MSAFERSTGVFLKPWLIVTSFIMIALIYAYVDKPLAIYLHGADLNSKLTILAYINKSSPYILAIISIVSGALLLMFIQDKRAEALRLWILALYTLIPYAICKVMKMVLGRARPQLLFDDNMFGFYGWHTNKIFNSFPSGHTTAVCALAFGFCMLYPRLWLLGFVLGLFMMVLRVLFTYHYLSDVLASFYLVVLEINLLCYIMRRYYPKLWGLAIRDWYHD